MEITYNNQWDYNSVNYLTFTEIPNILKVEETIQGTMSKLDIDLEGNMQAVISGDGQFYITLLGETITSVMSPSNAKNKRFYVSSDEDSTAFSMAQAFRNCSSLAAQFNIIHEGCSIHFISKTYGSLFTQSGYFKTNIPNQFITTSVQNGSVNSDLYNGKITVDVYKTSTADTNYVTTLEKNFYGDECAFDVSPVLATFSEYGKTIPYFFNINMTKGIGRYQGDWQYLGSVSGYTTIGYHANQSEKYLEMSGVQMLMHNWRNGSEIIRYVYGDTIPYSVLLGTNIGGWSYSVSYKDSAYNELYNSGTQTDHNYTSGTYIVDRGITIPSWIRNSIYYVDITLGTNTYRFNVIKPLKATEYYQRVEWRNEYGGISFFDFTSARSETDSVNIETYEKNVFDYHETNEFERKKIYKNNYDKTVKLTSHLMEEGGQWIFNSLMRSKQVWTYVNGYKYYIIPKSVEVTEDSTYNNIYKATLTYTYSDI